MVYSLGVNSTHHRHYIMASADSKFDDCFMIFYFLILFFCNELNLNDKNINLIIIRELSQLTCIRSRKMNSKFSMQHSAKKRAVLKFLGFFWVIELVLKNPDNLLA